MSVAMHTDLSNGLSDRKGPPRKEGRLQRASQVVFVEFRDPLQLLGMSFLVLLGYIPDRVRSPGFHFEDKSAPENQREPEPIGKDNMVEEFTEFLVFRSFLVYANGS
jgi:hypothetical protein